jgi:hypothetical protein
MGRVVFCFLKLTHEAETHTWMYILNLFEAVYIIHVLSLGKEGLECTLYGKNMKKNKVHLGLNYLTEYQKQLDF